MGCGKELANGQWWSFCGEADMGQTAPALCTHCGGEYVRIEDVNHDSVVALVCKLRQNNFELRKKLYPDNSNMWNCNDI